ARFSLFGRGPGSWASQRPLPSMPTISTPERQHEVHRHRPIRRLRCANLTTHGGGLAGHDHIAPGGRPLWSAALCLAPGPVRVCRLHDRSLVHGLARREARAMNVAEFKSKRDVANDRDTVRPLRPPSGGPIRRRLPVIPVLVTLATVALAAPLCWAMWNVYTGAPWTRDSTVRTYVVTKAPEVAGRIVELPVADNQFVHKGDLLLVIDPTNFKIAVSLAEAAVQQAQANTQNAVRESQRRQELSNLAATVEEKQTF